MYGQSDNVRNVKLVKPCAVKAGEVKAYTGIHEICQVKFRAHCYGVEFVEGHLRLGLAN